LENLEGGSYTGDFVRRMKQGSGNGASLALSVGAPLEGTWREGSFTEDPQDILSKALEMGVCFHKGPVLGNMR
jgi:hypothetical protein